MWADSKTERGCSVLDVHRDSSHTSSRAGSERDSRSVPPFVHRRLSNPEPVQIRPLRISSKRPSTCPMNDCRTYKPVPGGCATSLTHVVGTINAAAFLADNEACAYGNGRHLPHRKQTMQKTANVRTKRVIVGVRCHGCGLRGAGGLQDSSCDHAGQDLHTISLFKKRRFDRRTSHL